MRIIGGTHRKRMIHPPKNFKARPTTDRAKESLFNILSNYIDFSEIKVLDLFGGTGSISYEFASRGCNNITCIELNYKHYVFIKETINNLGFSQIKAYKSDVLKFLNKYTDKYDIIFADPPYDLPEIDTIPDIIFNNKLLNKNGLFILEHSDKTLFTNHPKLKEHRNYGGVNFSIFETLKSE